MFNPQNAFNSPFQRMGFNTPVGGGRSGFSLNTLMPSMMGAIKQKQGQKEPEAPAAAPVGQEIKDASRDRVVALLAKAQQPMQPMDMGSVISALQARMGQTPAPAAPPVMPQGSPIQGPMLAALQRRMAPPTTV